MPAQASEHAGAFAAFGLPPEGQSLSSFSPVFRVRPAGTDAVLKRTAFPVAEADRIAAWTRRAQAAGLRIVAPIREAHLAAGEVWTLYPWVAGRMYQPGDADLHAAGDLLGRLHVLGSADLSPFQWPDHDDASVQEDVDGLRALAARGDLSEAEVGPLIEGKRQFRDHILPRLRTADLPTADVSLDFRANNLIYGLEGRPTLIDPDNAEHAPRLLDLALSALLFNLDLSAPGRLYTAAEWAAFSSGYAQHVRLTPMERALWPTALRYMLLEWGCWHLITDESGWQQPVQRAFLTALAGADIRTFAL